MTEGFLGFDQQPIEQRPKPRAPARPWTPHEDNLLREAVAKYGDDERNWPAVAESVPGRDNKACRKRWKLSLSPTLKKSAWTKEEDDLLVKLQAEYPCRWSMIAKQISGRTDDACAKRYRDALDPSIKQGDWSEDEDRRLLIEYKRWGGRWASVATQLGRSGLHCRNRWRLLERKRARATSGSPEFDHRDDSSAPGPSCGSGVESSSSTSTNLPPSSQGSSDSGEDLSSQPPLSAQWNDLFDQFNLHPVPPADDFAPGSRISDTNYDLNIPIDPSLSEMFESQPDTHFRFDARVWDILNGGCGCGCGSNNGCGCTNDDAPPFMQLSSTDFLGPFQQLSRNFSHFHEDGLTAAQQPQQAPIPANSVPVQATSSGHSIPAPPMNTPNLMSNHSSHQHLAPFPTASSLADAQLSHNQSHHGSHGRSSLTPHSIPASYSPTNNPSHMSSPPFLPKMPVPMSPQTFAMFRELAPQLGNIDPVKFVAAIALARSRDAVGCRPTGEQRRPSCKCTGACCVSPVLSSTVGYHNESSTNTSAVRGSCCGGGGGGGGDQQPVPSPYPPGILTTFPVNPLPVPSSSPPSHNERKRSCSPPTSLCSAPKRSKKPHSLTPQSAASGSGSPISRSASRFTHDRPRLSSQLKAVDGDASLRPYACGTPCCWQADGDIRARFNTSGELLDHWRKEHEGIENEPAPDGKVFRCALEGCGKGWKSINGIQYHLQISKAHFAVAINKQVLGVQPLEFIDTSSIGAGVSPVISGEADSSVSSLDEVTMRSGVKQKHACPHDGCPKVYKQSAGLKYHLGHGHPQVGPVQLTDLPPVLSERVSQGSILTPAVR